MTGSRPLHDTEQALFHQHMAVEHSRSACVVIPLYRFPLPRHEQASLERCVSILGSHPIAIVKPESLDLTEIFRSYPQITCENFPDRYFEGIAGYNQLMLSDDFYARFAVFEYILIHQLDAFVFHDALTEWCNRRYDYVGAPWLSGPDVLTWHLRLRKCIRRRLYRWTNRQARREPGLHYTQYADSIGNGGFSLRRVRKMREVLAQLAAKAEDYRNGDVAIHHEDLFFCVEANRYWNRVKVPSLRKAAHFAWELQPAAAAVLTGRKLPFGCHAWDKLHRDDWRPIFQRMGISIDGLLS